MPLAKTTATRCEWLWGRILGLHSYDVACIERPNGAGVLDPFGEWVAGSVDG